MAFYECIFLFVFQPLKLPDKFSFDFIKCSSGEAPTSTPSGHEANESISHVPLGANSSPLESCPTIIERIAEFDPLASPEGELQFAPMDIVRN